MVCPTHDPCIDDANSLGNWSSEDPDSLLFRSFYFKGQIWDGDINSWNSCHGLCSSSISQADADNCALLHAAECESAKMFYNTAQTCTYVCSNGNTVSYTTPAESFVAESQAEADLMAQQHCSSVVSGLCSTPPVIPTPPAKPPKKVGCDYWAQVWDCDDGGKEYILKENDVFGWGKEDANQKGRAYAVLQVTAMGCLTSLDADCCKNETAGDRFVVLSNLVNFYEPYSWTLFGFLPTGMTIDYNLHTARISGTPTVAGSYPFRLTITDIRGSSSWRNYTIDVMEISTGAVLTVAEEHIAYTETIAVAGGYTAPVSYTIDPVGGSLPAGLSLDETTGIISGTPTEYGDFAFTVIAQDEAT